MSMGKARGVLKHGLATTMAVGYAMAFYRLLTERQNADDCTDEAKATKSAVACVVMLVSTLAVATL